MCFFVALSFLVQLFVNVDFLHEAALGSMVPLFIGDRAGLWDEYAATSRLPGLWFKNDTTFMVSTGVDNYKSKNPFRII